MRILFLVLVLGNLGFAAWHAWISAPAPPTRAIRSGAPTIELYANAGSGELRPEPAASESGQTRAAGTLRRCISVGPFPNRLDVEDAVAALTGAGFETSQRTTEGDVWLGYWVYLDAIPTQAEAAAIVDTLSDEGIGEAYVIADGNNGNIVSLGVFSEPARAQQRFADAQALDLSPVIADRSQPGQVFWLDVTSGDGAPFDQAALPAIEVEPQPRFAACVGSTD